MSRTRGRWSSDEESETNQSAGHVAKKKKEISAVTQSEPELVAATLKNAVSKIERPKEPASGIPRPHNPIFDGCRSVDCYERLNYISQGTYGVVFRARDKITGEMVAIKQIKFDQTQTKQG
jgi:cell division cycle 2-like protein